MEGPPHPLFFTVAPFRAWRGSSCAVGGPVHRLHDERPLTIILRRSQVTSRNRNVGRRTQIFLQGGWEDGRSARFLLFEPRITARKLRSLSGVVSRFETQKILALADLHPPVLPVKSRSCEVARFRHRSFCDLGCGLAANSP